MRIIVFLLLISIFYSCYSVERNCADFKTGTFESQALIGTEIVTTKVIRKDSIEIDYFRGKVDTSSIRWINNCEFILKNINPKNRSEEKSIHMKILTTNGNEYTYEFNEVGKSTKKKATAKKIN